MTHTPTGRPILYRGAGRRRLALLAALAIVVLLAAHSYWSGGIISVLTGAVRTDDVSLRALRDWVNAWGALAPVAYVLLVIVEVLVAPLPGVLLYAPAGAIFGGAWGGTLSLIGNVFGAAFACLLGRVFGDRLANRLDRSNLARLVDRLRARGIWVIALLRLNPFTSSDLVSYAAGIVRVPTAHVALGSFLGLAPLCYAQAYLAEGLFTWLPGSVWVVVGFGIAYLLAVIALLVCR